MRQWHQKNNNKKEGFYFSDENETLHGKHQLTPNSKAAAEPSKKRTTADFNRKTLQFEVHDVNDSVKGQYKFNNSMHVVSLASGRMFS